MIIAKNTDWQLQPSLEDECADAVAWAVKFLEQFDTAKLKSVYAVWHPRLLTDGMCRKRKSKRNGERYYTIRLRIPETRYPHPIQTRRRPLYRNQDGTWPDIPEGCTAGDPVTAYEVRHAGKVSHGQVVGDERPTFGPGVTPIKEWRRLLGQTVVFNPSQAFVWLFSHEAFHFLRFTKQVPGKNTEIEADAYADTKLHEWVTSH